MQKNRIMSAMMGTAVGKMWLASKKRTEWLYFHLCLFDVVILSAKVILSQHRNKS